jgi:uncharacterized protein (DUF4415 family)
MNENAKAITPEWDDDDLPEWTEEMFDHAQYNVGDKVIRPATGVLTKDGLKIVAPFVIPTPKGRPPQGTEPKKQVTLRLDVDLIERFRAGGAGWQSRINATLRKAVGI